MDKTINPLGADPEFFIELKDGTLKSIIGLIGGSKDNPKIIDDHGNFKIQEDNVAAEYNIPPAYTRQQWIDHILWPQKYIAQLLGTDKFRISTRASASFPMEELQDPKAQEFGCDPDYDVWRLTINDKPTCTDPNFRTCGGHVHVGLEDKSPESMIHTIRVMDKYLGVWSVIMDPDTKRRQLYGKAGCFRPQPHGCEYRTLSNFWIFNKDLIGEIWDRTQYALTQDSPTEKEGSLIQTIINTGNIEDAKKYCKTLGL